MDSRVGTGYPSHGYSQEQDPHITGYHQMGEGEEEHQHHEKKPTAVLKKVKQKAKKIKETLTKHGHDHDHGHEHEHDHNLDGEDDEDEEMVEDPEIHGAPVYDSAAVVGGVHGQPEGLSQPGNFERSTALHDDPIMPRKKPDDPIPPPGPAYYETRDINDPIGNEPIKTDPTRTFLEGGQEEPYGQTKVNLQRPGGLEEDVGGVKGGTTAYGSNYETKVTDPTGKGAQEAGVTPILHSFDKMKIYDEPETGKGIKPEPRTHDAHSNYPTGTHDQFSAEPTDPKPVDTPQTNQSSYTEKLSSATSAIADKAISAKNVVASKLGYGEKESTTASTTTEPKGDTTGTAGVASSDKPAMGYGEKISTTLTEKLTPVYGKVAGAGAAVMSKMPGGGSGNNAAAGTDQGVHGAKVQQDKGTSMKGYLADKFRPGDEDKALSEVISETLHKRKEEPERGDKTMGKVTESEEVSKNLNTEHETPPVEAMPDPSSVNNPSKVVVDKLKGVVGSWFGGAKGEESGHVNQQAVGTTQGTEGFPGFRGEAHGGDVKAEQ